MSAFKDADTWDRMQAEDSAVGLAKRSPEEIALCELVDEYDRARTKAVNETERQFYRTRVDATLADLRALRAGAQERRAAE